MKSVLGGRGRLSCGNRQLHKNSTDRDILKFGKTIAYVMKHSNPVTNFMNSKCLLVKVRFCLHSTVG